MGGEDDSMARTLASFAAIVEPMTEAVLVMDRIGTVVAVNASMMALLGVGDRSSLLRPISEYGRFIRDWRVGDDPFAPDDLRRSLDGASIRRQRAVITMASGDERIVEFSTTPIYDGEAVQCAMLVLQDLTEAERTQAYWKAVGTAAEGLTAELNLERVLESAIDMIVASFGDRVVLGIWRLDAPGEQLHLQIHRGISDATANLLRVLPANAGSFICDAVRTRQPQYIEDAQATPPPGEIDRRLVADEGLSSWIASPLLTGVNLIGAMGYGLRAPHRVFRQDLEAVRTIGRLFAVALEHAELYEELESQRDALLQERQERSLFVSALAHDLRTPLTSLKASAQLLARSPEMSEERREPLLATVVEQSDRFARLVTDLSAVYAPADPRYALTREPVDLVPLIHSVIAGVETTTSAHRFSISAPDPVVGEWDAARLAQVLENLLNNAVKYSPRGGEVVVTVTPTAGEVLVSVSDQGVGLRAEDLPMLFQAFTRVGTPDVTEGSGLGLYIARNIIELHGGRIWADSGGLGAGVTVSLTLPYGRSAGRGAGEGLPSLTPARRRV